MNASRSSPSASAAGWIAACLVAGLSSASASPPGPDARPTTQTAATVIGTLQLHTVESQRLGKPRTIRVWLPPGYNADAAQRYDLLYMHDGQNCFDRATSAFGNEWRIDETLTALIAAKKVRPLIVVGIDNGGTDRVDELTYAADEAGRGGRATAYSAFVFDEVMPLVAKTYRTNSGPAHALIGGSSLGGLVSLEMARRNPHRFGGVMAMSPSLWWPAEPITPAVEADAGGLKAARVWIDMGTRESGREASDARHVDAARRMAAALTRQGVAHHLRIEQGAAHHEPAWAGRFGEAIQYLLAR